MDSPQQTVSIPEAMRIGLEHHQAGRLAQADGIYQQVLQADPGNAEALHLLGVIAHQVGKDDVALRFFDQALATRPQYPEALSNRGLALQALGKAQEALASIDRALALRSEYPEALSNRGNVLQELGRPQEALASYERALQIGPIRAEVLSNRGNVLKLLGRTEEALASFDMALRAAPEYAEALSNRGLVLQALKRHGQALASYDQALAHRPGYVDALNNRGFCLQEMGRYQEALESLDSALAIESAHAGALYNRGNVLQDLGRLEEALASYDRALSAQPGYFDAVNNRGNALKKLKRYEEALASYEMALSLDPGHAGAWSNRGTALHALDRDEEALASYEKALAIRPDYPDAHWNRGLSFLVLGNLGRGWEEIEWRWQTEEFRLRRRGFAQPQWFGRESIEGKTVLLHAEQGLGDALQFCRYAPMVAARGARVVLEVLPALKPLLAGLAGVDELIGKGEALPGFDFHCPLLSLPLAFGTALDSIPAPVPYVRADPDLVRVWRKRLGGERPRRIGVAWSATRESAYGIARSVALADFVDLIPEGVQCVSLQKDLTDSERALVEGRSDIVHFGLGFEDTAALVEAVDLVVSVDTSIAHLAGAMGKPVWILMPFVGDWRWMRHRENSPWYPTARLFRQPAPGDWGSVFRRVKEELGRKLVR